jgi:hypothetical protein
VWDRSVDRRNEQYVQGHKRIIRHADGDKSAISTYGKVFRVPNVVMVSISGENTERLKRL